MSESCPTCGTALESGACLRCAGTPQPQGTPFGRYLLQSELGRGGMGVVFRAWDCELHRAVALKTLLRSASSEGDTPAAPPTPGATPPTVARFLREARSAARLRHPNVIAVYDVGQHEGRFFFTMELIEGVGLDRWLQGDGRQGKGAPSFREIAGVLEGAARGLSVAHAQGVVHRDVKPSNILVDARDTAHLGDFGLAKDVEASTTAALTLSGALLGTPTFMSPEQAGGATEALGPQSDVFSLGSVLYFALTGRVPFQGETLFALLQGILGEEPVPMSRIVPAIPRDLEVICGKAMEKDARLRYASAESLADDLLRFSRGEPIQARPASLLLRARRGLRKRIGWIAAIAAFALVAWGATLAMRWGKGASAAAAVQEKRKTAQDLLARADVEGVHDRAGLAALLPRIQAAIDADPSFAAARLHLGRARERLGDFEGAMKEYASAAQIDPSLAEAHYREGCMRLWTGTGSEWDPARAAAREAFRRAGAAQPGSAYATLGEAYVSAFERDRKTALDLVERVLASGEPHADAWFLRGALHSYDFTRGGFDFGKVDDSLCDFDAAEADLTRGLEMDPMCAWGLASRGGVRFTIGDLDGARCDFIASLMLSPDRPAVMYMEARVALALDLYDECNRHITGAIHLRAEDKYYIIRAMLEINTLRYAAARDDMDQAVRLREKSAQHFVLRAVLREVTGDEAGARDDIRRLRALPEADLAPVYSLDKALSKSDAALKLAMGAFAEFDRVFTLPPARKKALREMQLAIAGFAWFKEGMGKLSQDPTSASEVTSLLFGFGRFMEERPSVDASIDFVTREMGLKSHIFRPAGIRWLAKMLEEQNMLKRKRLFSAKEYLRRAGAYYRFEQYAQALADLEAAEKKAPSDADLLYALATVRALQGKGDEATSTLERAIAAGWGHPEYTRDDPDFATLRDREEFKRLVQ